MVAGGLLAAMLGNGNAEPTKIRVGWVVAGGDAPLQQVGDKGTTPHQGQSYVLDLTHFSGTTPTTTAFASGDLDATSMSGRGVDQERAGNCLKF